MVRRALANHPKPVKYISMMYRLSVRNRVPIFFTNSFINRASIILYPLENHFFLTSSQSDIAPTFFFDTTRLTADRLCGDVLPWIPVVVSALEKTWYFPAVCCRYVCVRAGVTSGNRCHQNTHSQSHHTGIEVSIIDPGADLNSQLPDAIP